jgi:hypothetical protein
MSVSIFLLVFRLFCAAPLQVHHVVVNKPFWRLRGLLTPATCGRADAGVRVQARQLGKVTDSVRSRRQDKVERQLHLQFCLQHCLSFASALSFLCFAPSRSTCIMLM